MLQPHHSPIGGCGNACRQGSCAVVAESIVSFENLDISAGTECQAELPSRSFPAGRGQEELALGATARYPSPHAFVPLALQNYQRWMPPVPDARTSFNFESVQYRKLCSGAVGRPGAGSVYPLVCASRASSHHKQDSLPKTRSECTVQAFS